MIFLDRNGRLVVPASRWGASVGSTRVPAASELTVARAAKFTPAHRVAESGHLRYTFLVSQAKGKPQANVEPERLAELCRRWGIRELALFGSALRDDFGPDSDIDLVDFEPETVLGFRIFELERELSELFGGRRIDLVPRKFLNPRLRQRVLAEAQTQYAA